MADLIIETLDVSQLALSTVEMYMCTEDDQLTCHEVQDNVNELQKINSFLLKSLEDDSGLTPQVILKCERVNGLWSKIKTMHSMVILNSLLRQYHIAKEESADFEQIIIDDLLVKIDKFEGLLREIELGQEVNNNTYHILMEMQERIHQ
jgi:hypothetical protein